MTGLLVGSSMVTFLSPLQDHVRRMLHMADRSWGAAVVSLVQLTVTATVMLCLVRLGAQPGIIVFSGLAVANLISLTVGVCLARPGRRPPIDDQISAAHLARKGKWFVLMGILPTASGLAAAHLVVQLAGAEALGFSEAARVVAQPLIVLATGLTAVTGPRSMESARAMRLDLARRIERPFVAVVAVATCVYLLAFGTAAPWNPIAAVVGSGYEIPGLVALTVVSNSIGVLSWPYRVELMAGAQEVTLTKFEGLSGVLVVLVAALTGALLKSYAKPFGLFVYVCGAWIFLRSARHKIYSPGPSIT